jgi:hypothetical protein
LGLCGPGAVPTLLKDAGAAADIARER